jgi:rod shape-determining protein MreC
VLERLLRFERGPEFPRDFRAVNTSVLARSTQFNQEMTVAAGWNDGIREDDPVVTADGLIGKVARVASRVSKVTLLSDATSGVPAEDLASGAQGIVRHGAGGGPALYLDRVSKQDVVHVSDVIVTAGTALRSLPDIYPKGVPIGLVTSSGQTDTQPFKTVQVQPFADLANPDAVAVLVPKDRLP